MVVVTRLRYRQFAYLADRWLAKLQAVKHSDYWEKADFGTGRIGEIIGGIEKRTGNSIPDVNHEDLLDALCFAMQMSTEDLDEIISSNSPVSRTVKGHAFETFFDGLMNDSGVEIETRGGDTEVDRVVNGFELQLKTPTQAGTRGDQVQYKTHKTHGAKSEKESMDYYSKAHHFPDYLVGLISYAPLRILLLRNEELPRHPNSPEHIISPFTVNWNGHPALNAFDRLGIESLETGIHRNGGGDELLPLTSELLGVNSETVVRTIVSESNFRIWDMSIRGFVREHLLSKKLVAAQLEPQDPSVTGRERAEKADFVLSLNKSSRFFQMKGVSSNNCSFWQSDPEIATETQLTRGRVNDHPTQSRLYLESDFDYLVLALDPPIVKICREQVKELSEYEWEFYAIPTDHLERHSSMPHRLKSLQKFSYTSLRKFMVEDWASLA